MRPGSETRQLSGLGTCVTDRYQDLGDTRPVLVQTREASSAAGVDERHSDRRGRHADPLPAVTVVELA
jgi:hypothetical protein